MRLSASLYHALWPNIMHTLLHAVNIVARRSLKRRGHIYAICHNKGRCLWSRGLPSNNLTTND